MNQSAEEIRAAVDERIESERRTHSPDPDREPKAEPRPSRSLEGKAMSQESKPMPPMPQKLASQRNEILEMAPASSGKTNLLKHLYGQSLTRNQAILAKCADCCGYYIDGRADCEIEDCPLYPFMPYRGKK